MSIYCDELHDRQVLPFYFTNAASKISNINIHFSYEDEQKPSLKSQKYSN
jgi:hypothetical protein